MEHLGERVTDYLVGALSGEAFQAARAHVAGCVECAARVAELEKTRSLMLSAWPDEAPPRRVVFAPAAASPAARRTWIPVVRWLAPAAAAVALMFVTAVALPLNVRWGDGQFTVAYGKLPATAAPEGVSPVRFITAQPEPVDYSRIVAELQKTERPWLAAEVDKRLADQSRQIERLRGELAYFDNLQRTMWRETVQNTSSIQVLARRTDAQGSIN